jgi:hypothetical protein
MTLKVSPLVLAVALGLLNPSALDVSGRPSRARGDQDDTAPSPPKGTKPAGVAGAEASGDSDAG